MKILIIRTIAIEEDLSKLTYNNQGLGLATELSKLGHECALVYYAKRGNGRNEEIISDGEKIKVYHIEGYNLIWNAIYENKLYELCNQYDVIQVSECDQICSWQVYRRFPDKTVIYHGPYASKFTWKYNLRSRAFDFLFSNRSNFKMARVISKSLLAENYLRGKGFKNITTLGVGLNERLFSDDIDIPENVKAIIDNKFDNIYLLYIGAISKRKNLLFILKILKDLVYKKHHINCRLIIVGGRAYKENSYFDKCFEYIKRESLQKFVMYIPKLEQKYIQHLYKVSDMFLLATQYDIFGMVYLEALYFGVPVITTNCGGASLLIKDGENGFIRDFDKNGWIEAIDSLVNDPQKMQQIKDAGSSLIRRNFLWNKLAPKFLAIYEEILDAKKYNFS